MSSTVPDVLNAVNQASRPFRQSSNQSGKRLGLLERVGQTTESVGRHSQLSGFVPRLYSESLVTEISHWGRLMIPIFHLHSRTGFTQRYCAMMLINPWNHLEPYIHNTWLISLGPQWWIETLSWRSFGAVLEKLVLSYSSSVCTGRPCIPVPEKIGKVTLNVLRPYSVPSWKPPLCRFDIDHIFDSGKLTIGRQRAKRGWVESNGVATQAIVKRTRN